MVCQSSWYSLPICKAALKNSPESPAATAWSRASASSTYRVSGSSVVSSATFNSKLASSPFLALSRAAAYSSLSRLWIFFNVSDCAAAEGTASRVCLGGDGGRGFGGSGLGGSGFGGSGFGAFRTDSKTSFNSASNSSVGRPRLCASRHNSPANSQSPDGSKINTAALHSSDDSSASGSLGLAIANANCEGRVPLVYGLCCPST